MLVVPRLSAGRTVLSAAFVFVVAGSHGCSPTADL